MSSVSTAEYMDISIHSLARGRTNASIRFRVLTNDFNPLPRKRENIRQHIPSAIFWNFNPLPRKRENLYDLRQYQHHRYFNPLPRKRENDIRRMCRAYAYTISIHSLARGRTYTRAEILAIKQDFNPLPRKRENRANGSQKIVRYISIHSLARGRT